MKRLLPLVLALATPLGIALVAVWPSGTTSQVDALTTEQVVAASVRSWPAPGKCVLVEAVIPSDLDGGPRVLQRPYEVCSRTGAVESPDAGAFYEERSERLCRQAARDLCGLSTDAGEETQQERVASQKCSQEAQQDCRAAARRYGVAWQSEPYPWVAQPAIRAVNRPGAIWRAHGCVCKATAGACKYWPKQGEDAGVNVPPATMVSAATVSGAGCIDGPCSETNARGAPGDQIPAACRTP